MAENATGHGPFMRRINRSLFLKEMSMLMREDLELREEQPWRVCAAQPRVA